MALGEEAGARTQQQLDGLLTSYGALHTKQDVMERVIEERTHSNALRVKTIEDTLATKANVTDLAALDARLATTNKILMGVLMAIVLGSITFAFTALQIVGSNT